MLYCICVAFVLRLCLHCKVMIITLISKIKIEKIYDREREDKAIP